MDWLQAMNKAIDYLEETLTEKLNIEGAAKLALTSPFHFQRMFHMITGLTVAEYRRRRRLTLAAQEIMLGERVIDVALKYGYETPEAFTKAFRKMHGMSPSAAREPGGNLKAFPKLSFHISIKGDKDMNYKIMDKSSFKVMGRTRRITTKDGENLQLIPAFWNECMEDGSYERICSLADESGVFGICMNFEENYEAFTYMIAVKDNGSAPEDLMVAEMPAARWAVFESVGPMPGAIQKVWERIFSEWFPATGYQQEEGPQLEVYPLGNASDENYKCEVWIPIKK